MEIIIPLAITFVILKLTHVINWSWWWVLSPLWIAGIISAIWWGVFGTVALFARLFKSETKTTRSKRRILFCVIGIILFNFAMWQRGIAFEYYDLYEIYQYSVHNLSADILLALAYFFAIFGSYLWAKEKGRSWKWAAIGLIGPFGYIVLRKLKDKHIITEPATLSEQQAKPIILPPPKPIINTKQRSRKKRTINFCPECGSKVSEEIAYCPNCGRKLTKTSS